MLIFVADLSGTGVVRNAIAIANHLSEQGYAVEVVTCRAEGVLRHELSPGVCVTELLPLGTRLSRPLRLLLSLRGYRSHLVRSRPDIILSAGNHGHLLTRMAASAAPDARTIYRISNDLDHEMAGRPESRWTRIARWLQFRIIARSADRIAVVSSHLLSHPLVASESTAAKIRLVQNGVDLHSVRSSARSPCNHPWLQGAGPPTLVAIGRFVAQKNFETLLRAVSRARQTKPVRLVLIGNGPEGARRCLVQEINRLGISDAIDMVPPVSNPFAWLARAAALVVPSWWEGSSNVLLEALACGTPIIASHSAGNSRSVLGYGRFGLLVDPKNSEEMAEAILIQTGPDPVLPGRRAKAFDRSSTLAGYHELVSDLQAKKPMPSCGAVI